MGVASLIRVGLFKSPDRVVAAVLPRSRETQGRRAREKSREIRSLTRIGSWPPRVIAKEANPVHEQPENRHQTTNRLVIQSGVD